MATGLVLTVDDLPGEDAERLQEWLAPIAQAVGADILVTDDADAFKTAADELGLAHQVCKGHVTRNTERLIESLSEAIGEAKDDSLAAIGLTPQQAIDDLKRLEELIHSRQPGEEAELERCTSATSKPLLPARDRKPPSPIACACCSSTAGTSGLA